MARMTTSVREWGWLPLTSTSMREWVLTKLVGGGAVVNESAEAMKVLRDKATW